MSTPEHNNRAGIPCVILAGGQSRRFGSNKAFASIHGERLIDVLIQRIQHQTSRPIAINAAADSGFGDLSQPILTDQVQGRLGPLAGIHAAMQWASQAGYDVVVTTPVDTPLLPENFVEHLVMAGTPSIAAFEGRLHPAHGAWPTRLSDRLAQTLANGLRAARDWAEQCQAPACEFHDHSGQDPFFNINTQDDLRALETAQPVSPR
ncbi:MAG: molybdenum cofactor guanylyltransferase [Pseudomonadota bacterium]